MVLIFFNNVYICFRNAGYKSLTKMWHNSLGFAVLRGNQSGNNGLIREGQRVGGGVEQKVPSSIPSIFRGRY